MDPELLELAEALGNRLLAIDGRLVTVESCTGGGISWILTAIPGSSRWFERALVTYSNAAKHELADVPEQTITRYGAVSEETARAMAEGGARRSGVAHALSVTGVAGPDGGTADKPVGMVCFGWALDQGSESARVLSETRYLDGDRAAVRLATIRHSLARCIELLA